MSLSSLRSFSGAASFATNALDTARSTFKAMAEAAVPPAEADGGGSSGASGSSGSSGASGQSRNGAPVAAAEPAGGVKREDDRSHTEKRQAGMRKGIALDAYA